MPRRLTTEEFIKRAKDVHGDKYDYSKVIYVQTKDYVTLICKIHGDFLTRAVNHIAGNGCLKCAKLSPRPLGRLTQKEFIDKAFKLHGTKYDYSKAEYITAKIKVKIICPIHGEFLQLPSKHLRGHGCYPCAYALIGTYTALTTKEFIDKAVKIHGNQYDLSFVEYGKNTHQKVKVICRKHGPYKISPASFLKGTGCPNCRNSRGENKIREYLKHRKIRFIQQKKFKTCKNKRHLSFDFYVKDYKLLIEYDGAQHFNAYPSFGGITSFEALKIRDEIKNQWAIKKDYNLLRIKHTSFNDLDNVLESVLKAIKDP